LEMPSTLGLASKDKHAIMMGLECCWDQKHIDNVRLEHSLKSIEYSSKVNLKKLPFTHQFKFNLSDPVHPYAWYAFLALQAADVWTTDRGMDFNCVYEANPLLPDIPSIDRIILHKLVFLSPINVLYEYDVLTYQEMILPFALSSYVVYNNLKIIDNAKQNCSKR